MTHDSFTTDLKMETSNFCGTILLKNWSKVFGFQNFATTPKCRNDLKNTTEILKFINLSFFSNSANLGQSFLTKTYSKCASKRYILTLKIFVQFLSRILSLFRNHYFIDAYSVFKWCFTVFYNLNLFLGNKRMVQSFQIHSKSKWSRVRNSTLWNNSTLTQHHLGYSSKT
jgi:hypothetical protein